MPFWMVGRGLLSKKGVKMAKHFVERWLLWECILWCGGDCYEKKVWKTILYTGVHFVRPCDEQWLRWTYCLGKVRASDILCWETETGGWTICQPTQSVTLERGKQSWRQGRIFCLPKKCDKQSNGRKLSILHQIQDKSKIFPRWGTTALCSYSFVKWEIGDSSRFLPTATIFM